VLEGIAAVSLELAPALEVEGLGCPGKNGVLDGPSLDVPSALEEGPLYGMDGTDTLGLKEKTGVAEVPEDPTELERAGLEVPSTLEGGVGSEVSGPVSGGGVAKVGGETLLQV
jgi:hypothetical protein